MKKLFVLIVVLCLLIPLGVYANELQDEVRINPISVVCGEQTIHITGTATYQEGHQLRVDLGHPPFYGNIFISSDKLPSWDAGSYTVGVGSWGIRARIYTDTEGGLARRLSEDILLFEVEECPPTYPTPADKLDCSLVRTRMINDSNVWVWGFAKVTAGGVVVSDPPRKKVFPGGMIQARWVPPDGFVGEVIATVTFRMKGPGTLLAEHTIRGSLNCHEYGAYLSVDNTCAGLDIDAIITDYGNPIHTEHIDFVPWIDPYVLESFGPETGQVPLPDGSFVTLTLPETFEPEECLVVLEHNFEIVGEADGCVGWSFTASASDGGIATPRGSETGTWSDPYTLESVLVLYDFVWPDGWEFTSWGSVSEPEDCLIVVNPEYGASIYYDGCEGYCAVVMPDQRGATVSYPDGPCGEWQEPHTLEEVTVSFVIHQPDGTSETHEIVAIEPEDCWIDPCPELFEMWLLRGTHPDANGILECYIVSPTHPGVVRYQRICFPCQYPDFVASWAVSGGVNACDVWELDEIRMYWRKSLGDLLAMNARHAAGIYYPIECEGCE